MRRTDGGIVSEPRGRPELPLTDATCKDARCPEWCNFKRFSDAGGMYLETTKTCAKLWRLKYHHIGKQQCLARGV